VVDPYLLDLPAVVSFSGGRTSGFMLRQILDAHGGQPDDLKVCFQNTGLEHPATYQFVQDVADSWEVEITWIEYCLDGEGLPSYRVVDFDTASRDGEPFAKLIGKKNYLPNPVARICTGNLKVETMERWAGDQVALASGFESVIGLRADEPRRALRVRGKVCVPVFEAGDTEADVLRFWQNHSFDLGLPLYNNHASNCVGCFLKGRDKLELLMLEMPEAFDWWIDAEATPLRSAPAGGRFRSDRPSYAAMMHTVQTQGQLFTNDEDTIPCMCTD
jgi:hypothetical protein